MSSPEAGPELRVAQGGRASSVVWWTRWPVRLGVGLAAGAAIAWVDNLAFDGEVSPIVVVALLLCATVTAGAVWGRRAWGVAAAAWAWVPAAHVAKRILGLPDTLHPNTLRSILLLAGFTLVVAIAGTLAGILLHGRETGPGSGRGPGLPGD